MRARAEILAALGRCPDEILLVDDCGSITALEVAQQLELVDRYRELADKYQRLLLNHIGKLEAIMNEQPA